MSASLNDRDSGDDDMTVRMPDFIGESSNTMQGTLRGNSVAKTVLTTQRAGSHADTLKYTSQDSSQKEDLINDDDICLSDLPVC